ncbi:pilus assembly protein TadG-related protein [Cypionkella sp.]|uniref:pilus assembly protein TadG-related protein n=1 Tax=Cypionkella sp. TaxID=2811411 RepID=UPI002AC93D5B|nr:pilus assembly protein TadG-related protein [Cypionkella sp.]
MSMFNANVGDQRDCKRKPPCAVLKRFYETQDGSLSVLALCLFLLMVMMGGLAVDLMRYEQTRTTLQNTLDRATLASASLTQTLDPAEVVADYFTKAGMEKYLEGVTVTEGLNYRNVTADASAATDPFFMHLIGHSKMDAKGHSMAEQRVTNVEIMLVLDVSGSMASNSKLANLKTAAKEFVDTVLSSDPEHKISIGIVPFNGQVNIGPDLRAKYTALTDDPGVTNVQCVDLPSTVYNSTALPTNTVMSMTAHADTYSGTDQTNSYVSYTSTSYAIGYHATNNSGNVWCPPIAGNIIRLPSQSISSLQGQINGLVAVGATSINAGLKWGLALMDPSAENMYDQLISAGKMTGDLSGRPFSFTDPEAMKVIVLMTDGEHFAEERVNSDGAPNYKSGNSPIYKSVNDGNYSIYHAGVSGNKYWVPHLSRFQALPWTNSNNTGTYSVQTWPQVWGAMRLSYVAWQFYARALGSTNSARNIEYANRIAAFRSQTPTTSMDSQLQQICGLAKGQGVIVYGIAFEAPTLGQTQIRNCSTSSAHYFNAAGLQIRTAFRSIASNISQLRLTQ